MYRQTFYRTAHLKNLVHAQVFQGQTVGSQTAHISSPFAYLASPKLKPHFLHLGGSGEPPPVLYLTLLELAYCSFRI